MPPVIAAAGYGVTILGPPPGQGPEFALGTGAWQMNYWRMPRASETRVRAVAGACWALACAGVVHAAVTQSLSPVQSVLAVFVLTSIIDAGLSLGWTAAGQP